MKNICIVGLGTIKERIAKGIQYAKNAQLYAICTSHPEKGKDFARRFQVPKIYSSLTQVVRDPLIDLVYICTPNKVHKEQILFCLQNKKNVLCEKPMVLHSEDLSTCFQIAKENHCFLMEAHKTVFTPLNHLVLKYIQEGRIGKIHKIEAQNASALLPSGRNIASWHYEKEGGGCLYDIGVYPIAYANFMVQSPIKEVQRMELIQEKSFISQAQISLSYENGIMAQLSTSWLVDMENKAYIYGEKGRIICSNYWKNTEATLLVDGKEEPIKVSMESDFTPEIEHAVECIENGLLESPIMGYQESLEILRAIEY